MDIRKALLDRSDNLVAAVLLERQEKLMGHLNSHGPVRRKKESRVRFPCSLTPTPILRQSLPGVEARSYEKGGKFSE
jgi:hypothetical protein